MMKLRRYGRRLHSYFPLVACAVGIVAGPVAASITVDSHYTFNAGSESDFSVFYKSGSEAPIHMDGQVELPPNTYLRATGLYSLPSTNFGVEVILTQTSDTWDDRWVLDTCAGYQLLLYGKSGWAVLDDVAGEWYSTDAVTPGTEYRLAIVVTNDTASGTVTETFYRDGVVIGSRTGAPGDFPAEGPVTDLIVGAANREELTGWADTPSTIKVNEIRLFHFDEGQFDAATDLLTGPSDSSPLPPVVTLIQPGDNGVFLAGAEIPAAASVRQGTAPYTVQFHMSYEGGLYSQVWPDATEAPYEISLGTLSTGSYSIYAMVVDATNGMAISATSTFLVSEPMIVVDRQYTFNAGPETDLSVFYRSGSEAPVYSEGQVSLGPDTYLNGTGVIALPPLDFGMEVILTQTSDTWDSRWVLDAGAGYQFNLYGKMNWAAADDVAGTWAYADGVIPGTETRLALVVTSNPDATVTATFYRDGTSAGSRTGPPGSFASATLSNLWVGAANRTELTGGDVPSTIRVNEIRLFHFDAGMFSPGLLLTGPTPVPLTANFSASPTNGPAPLMVTFADTSAPGPSGTIMSRYWEFGDGAVLYAGDTNLTYTYTSAGAYDVRLTVLDDVGGVSTNTKLGYIVVDPPTPPTAEFSAVPVSGERPLTVTFSDSSTPGSGGEIATRYWDFGDGETTFTSFTNLTHIYTHTGVYDVELVVSDVNGSTTNFQPGLIRVEPPAASYREAVLRDGPVAYYEMNETGGTVATDTMGTVNAAFATNAVLGHVNVAFPSLGTGAGLTTLSEPGLLTIPPSLPLSTSGSFSLEFWYRQTRSVVTGQNHLFRPATNGWDGSFFESHVTDFGSFYCNGYVTGPGSSPFDVWHHLVVTRDSDYDELWYLDGTMIASQANSAYLLTPGVAMSFGGGGRGGSSFEGILDEIAIYTNVLTPARIAAHYAAATNYMPVTASFAAVPTGGLAPLKVTFTDTSTGAPVYSRHWDFGDGATTNTAATTVIHNYTAPHTTNTVRLVVSGPINASTNTIAGCVVVGGWEPLIANFSAAPTSGIAPLTVTFTDTSTPGPSGPILSRSWDFGDGSSVTTNVTALTHVYTRAGVYGVTLVVRDSLVAGTNTQSDLITVLPLASSYREAVLRDGPVAYYELNETDGTLAMDTMGLVNGTYASNAVLGQANAEFPSLGLGARITTLSGPALLTIPDTAAIQTAGEFSVECWYRQTQAVVTGSNQPMRLSNLSPDGSFVTCIVLHDGVVYCNGVWTEAGKSPFNVWHHLVLTRDSNQNALWYLDGEVIVSQKISNILLTPGFATVFGGGSGDSAFEGTMDEIAIYTNVLTPARIAAHYAAATNYMPVTARFNATPTNGPAPLEVTFTDTSTGAPVNNRYWEFGDGATTNTLGTTVTHRYTTPSTTNTVRLVVDGPLNSSTNTQTGLIVLGELKVPPPPVLSDGSITFLGGVPSFSFGTVSGFVYSVDYRDTLIDGFWIPLINLPNYPPPDGWSPVSTGAPMTLVDTNAAGHSKRFYRLRSANP